MIKLTDFPKIECPFVRKIYKVDKTDWRKYGHKLQLREPKVLIVTPEINEGYEWVLHDKHTIAVEKLNGTNVKLLTEKGSLVSAYNRKNPIDMLKIIESKGKTALVEGIFQAVAKGYIQPDGEQVGEIIGKSIQGNPYKMNGHMWYPFDKAIKDLLYRSFHEHDRTFENWDSWFKNYLVSRYYTKRSAMGNMGEKVMAEGVIFYNLKRKEEGRKYMAKLRRDMFPWYYSPCLLYRI